MHKGKAILREYSGAKSKAVWLHLKINCYRPTTFCINFFFMFKGPIITDSGNFLLDWIFESNNDGDFKYDWKAINVSIKMIPGKLKKSFSSSK